MNEGKLKKRILKSSVDSIKQDGSISISLIYNAIDESIKDFPQKGGCCYDCGSEYDTESIDEWIKRWLNLVRKSREERNSDF